MTTVRSQQDVIFNRTGRLEIPSSHVRRSFGPCRISFQGLHRGGWCDSLSEDELATAVLYVDIHSIMHLNRIEVPDPRRAFDATWGGISVDVPAELTNGDHRVKLQITVAFPSNHDQAGRILARSGEIVIVEGPDGGGGRGPSLLKVRPSLDEMPDLSRLEISETEGPVLYVNAGIPGISWKELASDPRFKHGIFSSCVREVIRHLVVYPECRSIWGAAWLGLDGVRGLELPDVEDLSLPEAWRVICDFADNACEHLLLNVDLTKRFADALAGNEEIQ